MPKTILVTGAKGQLGTELQHLSSLYVDFAFTFISRQELDLSDSTAIQNWFKDRRFDFIINCAAYTAVDKAQVEPDLARAINSSAVETLACIAKAQNSAMLHISTDYVFNGKHYMPYVETDLADPQGIYGQTKREGELAMLAINPAKSIIIRTSWVYSRFGNNFVKTMLRLGNERQELGVIYDQVGTPTSASDLALTLLAIIQHSKLGSLTTTETYHFSNEGVCSWYDFAKVIFEFSAMTCHVKPIETKGYPMPAPRPPYSLLNKAKIKTTFDLTIPHWKDSLLDCLQSLTGSEHP